MRTIIIKKSATSFTVVTPVREPRVRLIPAKDVDLEHCVNCGGTNMLYWTGSVVRCLKCDHAPVVDQGMTFKAFKDRLAELVSLEILNQLPRYHEYIRED